MSCHDLQARVSQLEAENAILARQVLRLEAKLKLIAAVCSRLMAQADNILAGHQPRGKWSYVKGAKAATQSIARWL